MYKYELIDGLHTNNKISDYINGTYSHHVIEDYIEKAKSNNLYERKSWLMYKVYEKILNGEVNSNQIVLSVCMNGNNKIIGIALYNKLDIHIDKYSDDYFPHNSVMVFVKDEYRMQSIGSNLLKMILKYNFNRPVNSFLGIDGSEVFYSKHLPYNFVHDVVC